MAITPSFQRHRLFSSFFFLLDIKLGCTILTLFNLFNKSAGVFGLLAIFQGGTLAQLSLYAYSLGTIFISLWGLRGISEESAPTVMLYAHMYLGDHLVSSLWSFYFFRVVYYNTEHNGQPPALSPYQSGLMALIESIEEGYIGSADAAAGKAGNASHHHVQLEGQARVEAAQQVWRGESTFSGSVLALGWLLKIYFALLLYSYALHLRHGTYRSLPLSKPAQHTSADMRNGYVPLRASISIERPAAANGSRSTSNNTATATPTAVEDLPGWGSDSGSDSADDGMDVERGQGERANGGAAPSSSSTTRATLDRLSAGGNSSR